MVSADTRWQLKLDYQEGVPRAAASVSAAPPFIGLVATALVVLQVRTTTATSRLIAERHGSAFPWRKWCSSCSIPCIEA